MNAERMTFDQIRAFLDATKRRYRVCEEPLMIEAGFRLPSANYTVYVRVGHEPVVVLLFVEIPIAIAEDRRPAVAEAIARMNHGLLLGGFTLDMQTGSLWFRASMPAADNGITQSQLQSLLDASLWTADRYYRAFGRLVFGDDLSPAEVVAEVEMAK